MKICSKCQILLPTDQFHRNRGHKDGLSNVCKPCGNAISSAWRKDNPERSKEYLARWRQENRERSKTYQRRYMEKNPEYSRNYVRKRRYRQRDGAYDPPTRAQIEARIARCGSACVYCGGPYKAMDHLWPIAKGGAHTILNLVTACGPCNVRKATQNWLEWFRSQPFYSPDREERIRRLQVPV